MIIHSIPTRSATLVQRLIRRVLYQRTSGGKSLKYVPFRRLTGEVDGKPKIFRDSVVENLNEFFDRFRELNVRSNEQLDELVGQCRQIVSGVEPQSLRDNNVLRQSVASELNQVQCVLDDLLVDRPRRNILRRPK